MVGVMSASNKKIITKTDLQKKSGIITCDSNQLRTIKLYFVERHKTHSQHSVARVVLHEYGLCHGCNV